MGIRPKPKPFLATVNHHLSHMDTYVHRTSTCPIATTQEKKASKPLCHAMDLSKARKKDATATSFPEFYQDATFLFFSVNNFRKSLEVGLILAIMLRHLATGETCTSLQYQWLVGQTIICKSPPPLSAEPSLLNSRMIFVLPY